ncbi:hypothetical protein EDD18DRAFT_1364524 [Armillaria luteobubalina]|uniref:Uncharacterized protein n=1 Tax=Armillaria luteobubalina TaxID=153913 RepID=A0AA39P751_9AGAR|nr:hypothetical protein EDD18DRAFT_1364524 [Armillaria luteobubalina]
MATPSPSRSLTGRTPNLLWLVDVVAVCCSPVATRRGQSKTSRRETRMARFVSEERLFHQSNIMERSIFSQAFKLGRNMTVSLAARRFASSTSSVHSIDSDQTERAKPKPKATTPLRRSASASLPIRANPTPTRSDIQTVFTLTTAERYLLSKFRAHPNLIHTARPFHERMRKQGHR